MKHTKSFVIILFFGIALSGSVVADANSNKVDIQKEITLNNASTEIENILSVDEQELFYDSLLSEKDEEIYTNGQGDYYYFGDTGDVTGYTCKEEAFGDNGLKADEEKVKKAAEKYLKSMVEDPTYYQLKSIDYDEYVYIYSFMYTHQIDSVDTNDVILLGIDNDLKLVSFSLPRPYAFQEMDNMQIDRDKIEKEALDIFSKEHNGNTQEAKVAELVLVKEDDGKMYYLAQVETHSATNGNVTESIDTVFIPIE